MHDVVNAEFWTWSHGSFRGSQRPSKVASSCKLARVWRMSQSILGACCYIVGLLLCWCSHMHNEANFLRDACGVRFQRSHYPIESVRMDFQVKLKSVVNITDPLFNQRNPSVKLRNKDWVSECPHKGCLVPTDTGSLKLYRILAFRLWDELCTTYSYCPIINLFIGQITCVKSSARPVKNIWSALLI